jgi:DNA-binding SARP family transcriptional activator
MKALRVLLLGTPEVRWEGELLQIQRRYPRALLLYLASQGAMVGREELLTVFWEDYNEKTARLRLRETLNKLRASLPRPNILISQKDLVGLDFQRVWVDLLEFEKMCDHPWSIAQQIPPKEPLPDNIFNRLKEAVGLWRGPRFLAGSNLPSTNQLDEWLSLNSHRSEHKRGRILERLSEHAFVVGNYEESLHLARHAIENDELSENLHERILRILIRMDRRNEAREHFRYLLQVFRRELDQSPSPRLFSLYHLTHSPVTTIPSPPAQLLTVKTSLDAPFVGRQDHIKELNQAYQKGGAVLILGESGLGKTRLLKEFVSQLKGTPRLMLASCRAEENNLPFQPIIEMVRNSILPEEWINFPSSWINNLLPIIPDLADLHPEAGVTVELVPGQARSLMFEAIRQISAQIASQQRLIICLDNAQWADEATLAAMAYLLERPPFLNDAVLILAARAESSSPYLERLIRSLEENSKGTRIILARLKPVEISELVQCVLKISPSTEFIGQLAAESGGNPFFILEAIRTLLERGVASDISGGKSLPLARSVYLLILDRLNSLSALARSVLEMAAIVGSQFRPELVARAGDFPTNVLYQALIELERRQLIESLHTQDSHLYYRFIHDKIREALLLDINPVKLRWLHNQVARALEAYLQQDLYSQAAVLARHFELAGEWGRAFDYWVKAGQYARQLLSIEEAIRSFRSAEGLIRHASRYLSDEQIHHLYYEWNELTFDVHDTDSLQKQCDLLRKIGEERQSPLLVGTAFLGMGNACLSMDQFEEGTNYSTQAIQLLDKTNHLSQRIQAYIDRGVLLYMQSHWNKSMKDFERSLEIGKNLDEPQMVKVRANAHYNLAVIMNLKGRPLEARQHAIKAVGDSTGKIRTFRNLPGYSALALAQVYLGEYHQAKHSIETGIQLAEKTNNWRMLGYLFGNRALYERNTGNLYISLESALKMVELGERFAHNDIIALGQRLLGDIYFYLYAFEEAHSHYIIGLEVGGASFFAPDIYFRLGHTLCELGEEKSGKSYLHQALKMSKENGLGLIYLLAQSSLSRIYASEGKWEKAYQLAVKLENETRRRSLKSLYLRSIHLLGECAFANKDIELARQHFETTLNRSVAIPNPWIDLKAHIMLAKCGQENSEANRSSYERIDEILNQLEASLLGIKKSQQTKVCFKNFRKKIASGMMGI